MAAEQAKPLRLLSLDGGGVRGLSELLILKRIMHGLGSKSNMPSDSPPKPCDYFDLIGGTSTGGLIAIMLGTLEMDIDTCIKHYLAMAPKIFPEESFVSGNRFSKVVKGAIGMNRFDPKPLEEFIQRLVAEKFPESGADTVFDECDPARKTGKCKVFVTVTNKATSTGHILRDYRSAWDTSTRCKIWQAARATSAAPLFLPSIEFGNPPQDWVDGGLRYNNPVTKVFEEANWIWPSGRKIKCIISIGAGEPPSQAVGGTGKAILQTLVRNSLDTKQIAREFEVSVSQLPIETRFNYVRLNATGISSIGLEEWKHFNNLAAFTDDYLIHNRDKIDQGVLLLEDDSQTFIPGENFPLVSFPITPTPFFGRNQELETMTTILDPKKKGQGRLGICGLSGLGKTRLVLEFIEQRTRNYDYILWINASSVDSAFESFLEAAASLQSLGIQSIPSHGFGMASARGSMKLVIKWLEDTASTWLMVLDSFDNVEALNIREFFPRCHHGSIVITTTRQEPVRSCTDHTIDIQELDSVASSELLLSKLDAEEYQAINLELAHLVVDDLAGVPLAIEQASFILSKGFTLEEFQKHYNNNREHRKLMQQKQTRGNWAYEKNQSIFDSFETLFQLLERDFEESATLLCLLCCFSSVKVPMRIFRSKPGSSVDFNLENVDEAARKAFSRISQRIRPFVPQKDSLNLKLAAIRLQDYCLANIIKGLDGSIISISIHDSIWRWCRSRGPDSEMQAWSLAASNIITSYAMANGHERVEITLGQNLNAHLLQCFSLLSEWWDIPPSGQLGVLFAVVAEKFANAFVQSRKHGPAKGALTLAIESRKFTSSQDQRWPSDRKSCELLLQLGELHWQDGDMGQAENVLKELLEAEPIRSDLFDDIAVQAASKLRQVKDRMGSTRAALGVETKRDIQSESAQPPLAEQPATGATPALKSPDDEYLQKEYELTEIASQMREEFGVDDNETLLAIFNLGTFYADNGQILNALDTWEVPLLDIFKATQWIRATERNFHAYISPRAKTLNKILLGFFQHGRQSNEYVRLCSFAQECSLCLYFSVFMDSCELCALILETEVSCNLGFFVRKISPIELALKNYNVEMVQLLISRGLDVNRSTGLSAGLTPLHLIISPLSRIDVSDMRTKAYEEIIEILLQAGADVNIEDTSGSRPIHYSRTSKTTKLLLDAGADVNARDNRRRTPLSYSQSPAVIEALVEAGADVNARDNEGKTPLFYLQSPATIEALVKAGADVNSRDNRGGTPLSYSYSPAAIEALVEAGARPNRARGIFAKSKTAFSNLSRRYPGSTSKGG